MVPVGRTRAWQRVAGRDMADHLRFASASEDELQSVLLTIIKRSPILMRTLEVARDWALPDWWIVSGAVYNQVWNDLTGRPEMHGVKDIDLFYFDEDRRWEAEDAVIRHGETLFPPSPPVEIRNQARVHLWYKEHFGHDYPALQSSRHGIDHFACRTHCVGVRLADEIEIYAPYGLKDIFSFRVTPNPVLDNAKTHKEKAGRQKAHWPELEIIPWPS